MMSNQSSLLLLAFATAIPLISGFTCTWRGGDYTSFTYRIDLPGDCCDAKSGTCPQGSYGGRTSFCNSDYYETCVACGDGASCCDDPFSKQYERETTTTCCQCAGDNVFDPITASNTILTTDNCNAVRVPSDNPEPNSVGEIFGCDGFKPEISDADAAAQARAAGEWFTSPAQLDAYLAQTITCADDCWPMPAVEKNADTDEPGPYCRYTWAAACSNTVVTTNAKDQCGNVQTSAFTVRYDAVAPVVKVTLGDFTKSKIKSGWETVPLTVSVSDTCDPNALTSIEVFSDEAFLSSKYENSAVLGRTYANTDAATPLSGWMLTLRRMSAKKQAKVDTEVATPDVDGRFYTVRVCASDLAGNIGCDEAAIAVPPVHAYAKKAKAVPVPIDNGKLYKVASDLVYWRQAQNDIPFRLKNTGLNL